MFIFRFFHNLYVAIYRWYTLFLIRHATQAAAKLMKMSGKNPDYVPPTPAPYVPPRFDDMDINRAWIVDTKTRGNVWLVVDGYYVHHPKSHPILELRAQWEEKLRKAKEKLAAEKAAAAQSAVAETTTAPTMHEVLVAVDKIQLKEKTEVGATAINDLREAVHAVEKAVIEPEKKAS
jgi:hypothetical protein